MDNSQTPKPTLVPPPPATSRPAWKSKTMWISLATSLLPIVYPPAAVFIAANPELFAGILGALFAGLRVVTNDRVTIV